jgi:DNA invertase Pin-like site-specific DNA recombinase
MNGMTFELNTPHGRMMATMLAGIAQFERDLLSERVKSGLVAAPARGKKLGRQPGQRPKSDKLAPTGYRSRGEWKVIPLDRTRPRPQ